MSLPEIHLIGGTGPEAVELARFALAFRAAALLEPVMVTGGSHSTTANHAHAPLFSAPSGTPHITLGADGQAEVLPELLRQLDELFAERPPAAVVVQGDTITSLAGALAAYWHRIPVVHLDAGLRSGDLDSPFPGETNLRLLAQLTALHLAPTPLAAMNLLDEGITSPDVMIAGASVSDATLGAGRELPITDTAVAVVHATAGDRRPVVATADRPGSCGSSLDRLTCAVGALARRYDDSDVIQQTRRHPAIPAHVEAKTERAVEFYADAWIGGDRAAVRRMIAPDADVEWNLDEPVDDEELVQTLHRIAMFADSVTVVSRHCTGERAVLIYDCAAPFGTARFVEFLTVVDGRIGEVRQVYDPVAVRRFFPGLTDHPGSPDPFEPPD